MILVGLSATPCYRITDLELAGTVFEEGATLYVVYGTVLAVLGGIAYWAPEAVGPRRCPTSSSCRSPLLGCARHRARHRCRYYIAGFAKQAGGIPANDLDVAAMLSSTTTAPRRCGTCCPPSATASWRSPSSPSSA